MTTTNNTLPLRAEKAICCHCSRCNEPIRVNDHCVSVNVTEEKWISEGSIDVITGRSALTFCVKCSRNYNFKKIAVSRRRTEEDLAIEALHEETIIENARDSVSKALRTPPEALTVAQIQGWLLEQQYMGMIRDTNREQASKALNIAIADITDEQIMEWVDNNQEKANLV